MTWTLSSLSIQGVKGVLDRAGDFKLTPKRGTPRSIAIFGRNGFGKSGYADAIEYLFSNDGEVEHLGKGNADSEQGGKHAIPHVLAEEKGIQPKIVAEFTNLKSGKKATVTRLVVTGRNDSRPIELNSIVQLAPAHRILRQHDLRRFVVDMAPGEKFAEFARWIGQESTAKLLSHLTTTERTLRETDVDREVAERIKSIQTHTSGAVQAYDLKSLLAWCEREAAKYIRDAVRMNEPSDIEVALRALNVHREELLLHSPAAQAYVARTNLEKIAHDLVGEGGSIRLVETKLRSAIQSESTKDNAKTKASESIFQEVWESAQKAIETAVPDTCPICQTPWSQTKVGSINTALFELKGSLSTLAQYVAANKVYLADRNGLDNAIQVLGRVFEGMEHQAKLLQATGLGSDAARLLSKCSELRRELRNVEQLEPRFIDLLQEGRAFATRSVPQALSSQKLEGAPLSVTTLDVCISRLQGLREAITRLEALKTQQSKIRAVERQFARVADVIRDETKALAENAVEALRLDVQRIYKHIHPGEAIPNVYIDLDADRKALTIRVNFHSSERRVPPGGYLSEAHINTLGLALFLSAIRLFNREFPFVFLDDIVSSYDADNRAKIVDVLAEEMRDYQILLTTHDERFYNHLRQRLDGQNWLFEKIMGYEFERGPRRESDNLGPAQIDELIREGNARAAGNAVRQFMEEWFDNVCEKYQVYTVHRRDSREYQRTLFDYWQPFLDRTEKLGGQFRNRVSSAPSYQRLKGNMLINYYSHHQANPYEWSAVGDVEYTWKAFQEFTGLFNCGSCSKLLRFDASDSKLYCTCGGSILPPPSTNTPT